METTNNISALLIVYNEIAHIQSVIDNISFADEIIVIDSYSTDGTFEKLKSFSNVKTIQRSFKNFADQRNFAIKQAKHKWILFIDADERITPELKSEILETTRANKSVAGFMFKRTFFFKNKIINYSGFQTDTTYRLFKNGHIKYQENRIVHEMPIINGETFILNNKMLHYSFPNSQKYKDKMVFYAKLKALELYNRGKRASLFHFIFRPLYKFITNYIFRLGFLDGIEGFQLCYLSAYGVYYRYYELKRLAKFSPE